MKAVRIHGRGGPEQLVYEDAPNPIPQRGEALVRAMAAGVTPTELSWSSAYTTRDKANRLPAIPGHEFSGIVEAIGPGVTGVSVGQEVYALSDFWRDGSDAEYIVIAASDLAPKPRTLDFTQAAAIPLVSPDRMAGSFLRLRKARIRAEGIDPWRSRRRGHLRCPVYQMARWACHRNCFGFQSFLSPHPRSG